ncbi:peptidoglycan-binding domain-containing protein [Sporosalibacterium faouarense]|uniref:peptidoglycan-binding domain-containing protein n=1 Tax=Sporosalibacterium faouarense TaxID=516123 RepID=UPI00192AA91F|nr:peptidoglycan-binding protein [Sporosalibacterium faouarense]
MGKKSIALFLSLSLAAIPSGLTFADESHNLHKKGVDCEEIKIVQSALKQDGTYTYDKLTTYFGPITEEAVIGFQRKYGLTADGIVGASTIDKMKELGIYQKVGNTNLVIQNSQGMYKKGMNHEEIKVLQQALKLDGVYNYDELTTYFGPVTENAVIAFQRKYGLTPDGVIGASSLNKMSSLGLIKYSSNQAISRGSVTRKGFGEHVDWWSEVKDKLINRGDNVVVQDFNTGKQFNIKVTYGTNHADVEALTANDTNIMKDIWGGFSWERRPVLVYVGNRALAASMTNMPHAGVDNQPEGATLSKRSGGYGRGYNLDMVKNNGMSGVVDLHFKGSSRHKDGRSDSQHQNAIKRSAGLK